MATLEWLEPFSSGPVISPLPEPHGRVHIKDGKVVIDRQLNIVDATFNPTRTDDLQPGVADSIGLRCQWQAVWVIEEGPYAGQWAYSPWKDEQGQYIVGLPFAWVPREDLEIHRLVKGVGSDGTQNGEWQADGYFRAP
jgi:hypothetical protein